METLDKLMALKYIAINNPVCDNCARGSLDQVWKAAGITLNQNIKNLPWQHCLAFVKEQPVFSGPGNIFTFYRMNVLNSNTLQQCHLHLMPCPCGQVFCFGLNRKKSPH